MNAILLALFREFVFEDSRGSDGNREYRQGKLAKNPLGFVRIEKYQDTTEFSLFQMAERVGYRCSVLRISSLNDEEYPSARIIELDLAADERLVQAALRIAWRANVLVHEFQRH